MMEKSPRSWQITFGEAPLQSDMGGQWQPLFLSPIESKDFKSLVCFVFVFAKEIVFIVDTLETMKTHKN